MRSLCSSVVLAVTFAAAVSAHHSPSAIFDMDKKVTVTGTLMKVDWVNPHIVVLVDAKNAQGAVENWRLESNPPSWFKHVGLTRNDFSKAIGQTVTLEANHAKDGSLYGYMRKITFSDGHFYELVTAAEADK
jgi:Family of unknown function (DUF6152)